MLYNSKCLVNNWRFFFFSKIYKIINSSTEFHNISSACFMWYIKLIYCDIWISDTSPMSSRNFPASFWNSNYHSHHSTSQVYHPDTVYHHHGTASNPADPWQTHYQQYTAAAAHHHHRYNWIMYITISYIFWQI